MGIRDNMRAMKGATPKKMLEEGKQMTKILMDINANQITLEKKLITIQKNQANMEKYFIAICNKLGIDEDDL